MPDLKLMTCSEIRKLLHVRYCAPEWALFEEVANGTGASQKRYADGVAINLFPSRGLAIHGFEIKVSRSDLINELKNPHKAEEIAQYCDRWWVVAPAGMAKAEELPETWGLIEAHPTVLRNKKEAHRLQAKPLTRSFFAALARRAHEVQEDEICRRSNDRMKEAIESHQARVDHEVGNRTRNHQRLLNKVKEFEEASGIEICNSYDLGNIGSAVRMLSRLGITDAYRGIKSIKSSIDQLAQDCAAAVEEVSKLTQ